MDKEFTIFACGPQSKTCKCECTRDGLCEHQWDGPEKYVTSEGNITDDRNTKHIIGTVTCSRCGMFAIEHSMWL